MKDAFLHFAAPAGFVFRPGPVTAIEVGTQPTPAPTGLPPWWPTSAAVARPGDPGWTRAPLLGPQGELAKDSASKGFGVALLAHADDTFRLYRQNSFPFVGRESARKALEAKTDVLTWKATKADVARSGDLGYTYGTYEL